MVARLGLFGRVAFFAFWVGSYSSDRRVCPVSEGLPHFITPSNAVSRV